MTTVYAGYILTHDLDLQMPGYEEIWIIATQYKFRWLDIRLIIFHLSS